MCKKCLCFVVNDCGYSSEKMVLVMQQVQGTCATFSSGAVSQNKGLEFKLSDTPLQWVEKTGRFPSLRCKSCLSVGAPIVRGPNTKFLRIAALQGSAKNDESGSRASGSKSAKNSTKLSYLQPESENTFNESAEMQDVERERMPGSLAVQKLFKNWLTLLRTSAPPLPNEAVGNALEGRNPGKIPMVPDLVPKEERGNTLMAIWGIFWGLNATVKVPLLLFTPLYLAVNVAYGVQVSKELTPLWIFGPLIIALYVKFFQGICALYVFAFKQTIKVVKKTPAYSVLAYTYIADGKLKEKLYVHLWQPGMEIMNKNYKEFSVRMMRELQVCAVEKYLDFVELIWPTYCRTVRFLKRANLI